jgi:hypothetical protein
MTDVFEIPPSPHDLNDAVASASIKHCALVDLGKHHGLFEEPHGAASIARMERGDIRGGGDARRNLAGSLLKSPAQSSRLFSPKVIVVAFAVIAGGLS